MAGSVFYYQMKGYALAAKQAELHTTVESLAKQTQLLQSGISQEFRQFYTLSLTRMAQEDNITVLVTDADGVVELIVGPDGIASERPGYIIAPSAVREIRETGRYAEVGSMGVLAKSSNYAVGSGVLDSLGNMEAMVFVSTEDAAVAGMIRHSTQTLVLILLITLAVALLISFFIS